jgi:hypothetical protein
VRILAQGASGAILGDLFACAHIDAAGMNAVAERVYFGQAHMTVQLRQRLIPGGGRGRTSSALVSAVALEIDE